MAHVSEGVPQDCHPHPVPGQPDTTIGCGQQRIGEGQAEMINSHTQAQGETEFSWTGQDHFRQTVSQNHFTEHHKSVRIENEITVQLK